MLYDRDSDVLVDKVNYQLIESDGSVYTKKRWWGDFVTGREIKDAGRSFTLELSDGRRGECFVRQNAEMLPKADKFFYHFKQCLFNFTFL